MRDKPTLVFSVPVLFLLFMSPYSYAKDPLQASPISVENFCKTYTGQQDFLKDLSKKILKNQNQRSELVVLMRNKKANGCSQALSDYLNNSIENTDRNESYLLLAFAANLPIATKIIEKEIAEGKLFDWLDIFQKSDKDAYVKALAKWVEKIAQLVRGMAHAEIVDEKLYGKMTGNDKDIKTPQSIPIWNPMIINKYMSEVINQKINLNKNDFANLNIIYAASNQSYREIFLTQMSSVVSLSQTNWIMSFRSESPWVQFRLFPIMGKVGGGLMKRELIWLSQYHQNFKIRSLAEVTLDKVNAL